MTLFKNIVLTAFLFFFVILFVKGNFYERIRARTYPRVGIATDIIKEPNWVDRNSMYVNLSCTDKIVFIGNSIVEGGNFNELYHRDDIINRGIREDISFGILERMREYVKQKPKAIFINTPGINDVFNNIPADSTNKNMVRIVDLCLKNQVPLVIESTIYIAKKADKPYGPINRKVKTLNTFLERLCNEKHIPYVDLNSVLSQNEVLGGDFTSDGVHLNGKGYRTWTKFDQSYVAKIAE